VGFGVPETDSRIGTQSVGMSREIYTSKDGHICIVRAAKFCDECGQRSSCVHFAAASFTRTSIDNQESPQLTLCIPCFARLMHYIIAGKKYGD
jgi:hypothetical protein